MSLKVRIFPAVLSPVSRRFASRVRKNRHWRCFLAAVLLLIGGTLASSAQAVTTIPTPAALSGLVQAPDGNYYGATISQPYNSCSNYQANQTGFCGAIYRVTPAGVVSLLHTFAANGQEGYDPNPLVVGPDGNIYGSTQGGGTVSCGFSGCGTFFKLTLNGADGSFQIIHYFSDAEFGYSGGNQIYEANLGRAILGVDGYFYQSAVGRGGTGLVYKMTTGGAFQALSSIDNTNGYTPGQLVQGTDYNFYGSTYPAGSNSAGAIFRVTPSGAFSFLATLPYDTSKGYGANSPVELGDGNYYGFTLGNPGADPYSAPAGLYRVTPAGDLQTVSTTTAASKFSIRNAPLTASDGKLYEVATSGGDAACACGALLQVTPKGVFTSIQTFTGGDAGKYPQGVTLQASDGKLIVATGVYSSPTAPYPINNPTSGFLTTFDLNLPAPVQLSFTDANGAPITGSIQPGTPLTLSYKVPGAFSLSASQCYAFVQGNLTAAGVWTGKQSGTTDATGFHGSAQVTPTADGTFTYALTCDGTTSGFVTLNLSSKLQITTSTLPDGSVGKSYSNLILLDGGTPPFKFVADGLPPGIIIDPTSGYLTGKPTQFGTFQTTIAVQDSSTPALTAGKFLPLTVDSSLMLSGSLKNATVGTAYTGGLTAIGGFGKYKWTISAGTLPEGLTLNATTGVIAGKPTKGETASFSITVTDDENPVASVTLPTALSTVAPPLMVEEGGDFPGCTVGVLCEGQFDATGGTPPYTWTVAPGAALPAGLTLASDGGFSFKPIQYYDLPFQIEVQVTDSSKPALTATGINSLLITSSLKANPYTLPVATVGQAYSAPAPVAMGGLPPYTWALIFSDYGVVREYGANADGSLYSPAPKTAGTFTVTYVLNDSEKNQATLRFPVTLDVVAPLAPTTTTLSSSNSNAGSGMNVTLIAKVVRSAGVPTGQVSFYSGTTVLGVVGLDATGSASLATSFSAAGNYSLTAQYSGDAFSGGSVSAVLVETVVTPALVAAVTPGTLSIVAGASGTLTISLSGTGGYTGVATFTCGTLPAHVTCTFAPPTVSLSPSVTSGSSTLTINTGPIAKASVTLPSASGKHGLTIEIAALAGLYGLCFSRRSRSLLRLRAKLAVLLALGILAALGTTGCGSESPNATPGTYAIPVNVTVGGATVQTVSVSIVVRGI